MATNDIPSYAEAFRELQEIVSEIEQGEISVDDLSEKVKRASLLIRSVRTSFHAQKKM
jgi:exodeoxyribonuclease VII small subunit